MIKLILLLYTLTIVVKLTEEATVNEINKTGLVDECQDFYAYICDPLMVENEQILRQPKYKGDYRMAYESLLREKIWKRLLHIIRENLTSDGDDPKLSLYFRSCVGSMQSNASVPVEYLLTFLKEYDFLAQNYSSHSYRESFTYVMAKITRTITYPVFFSLDLLKEESMMNIEIVPYLYNVSETEIDDWIVKESVASVYSNLFRNLLPAAHLYSNFPYTSELNIGNASANIAQFEEEASQVFDYTHEFTINLTIADLQAEYGMLNWTLYFFMVFGERANNLRFSVHSYRRMKHISDRIEFMFSREDERAKLRDYMLWIVVGYMIEYLPLTFHNSHYQFVTNEFYSDVDVEDIEHTCLGKTMNVFRSRLEELYGQYIHPDSYNLLNQIFSNVKDQAINLLSERGLNDTELYREVTNTLLIGPKVSSPFYQDLVLSSPYFVVNAMEILKYQKNLTLKSMIENTEYANEAQFNTENHTEDTNMIYDSWMLGSKFIVNESSPENYGSIGVVIAYYFAKKIINYVQETTQDFTDLYSNLYARYANTSDINQDEMSYITWDIIYERYALEVAYKAMLEVVHPDIDVVRSFFVENTKEQCNNDYLNPEGRNLAKIGINVPLMYFQQFSNVYNCSEDSPMNPPRNFSFII